ncbi:MAG: type II toxin-antitoxin system RelB/DinJ family antitoxin [Schwartzia sp. (in: firmicutes)]
MAQAVLSIRVNSEDKRSFEHFCEQTGLNVSVAVNMFLKAVIREQRLPFEVKADPFYSEINRKRLRRAIDRLDAGQGTIHEVAAAPCQRENDTLQ